MTSQTTRTSSLNCGTRQSSATPAAAEAIRPAVRSMGVRLLLGMAMWQLGTSFALAQIEFGRPNDRPTFSPYLNLFRRDGGGNAVLNYYGLVRPQNEFYRQSQVFGAELRGLQLQQQAGLGAVPNGLPMYSQMGITGHPTAFMTINGGGGGGSFGGLGGGGFGAGAIPVDGPGIGTATVGGGGFGPGPVGAGGFGGGMPAAVGSFGTTSVTGHPAVFGAGGGSAIAGPLN